MQLLADVQNLELSNFADPCPNGCLAGSGSFRQLVGTTPLPTKALSAHPVETPCNHLCQATFVGNSFDWSSVANLSHRADSWTCPAISLELSKTGLKVAACPFTVWDDPTCASGSPVAGPTRPARRLR